MCQDQGFESGTFGSGREKMAKTFSTKYSSLNTIALCVIQQNVIMLSECLSEKCQGAKKTLIQLQKCI
jgi:hypothetical protein